MFWTCMSELLTVLSTSLDSTKPTYSTALKQKNRNNVYKYSLYNTEIDYNLNMMIYITYFDLNYSTKHP